MTKRLERIFSEIPPCDSFADVGCDHGFIAQEMILSGKCNRVIISDISEPSLQKAKKLLHKQIEQGAVTAVVCDGLKGIDSSTQTVLIAGMGGEEIIKILTQSTFLPQNLVLQPMKNVDKVRRTLVKLGYAIVKDYLFYDKKYYNLLICIFEGEFDPYTEKEYIFGRDNLKNKSADFMLYLKNEIALMQNCLSLVESESEKRLIEDKLNLYKEVYNGN